MSFYCKLFLFLFLFSSLQSGFGQDSCGDAFSLNLGCSLSLNAGDGNGAAVATKHSDGGCEYDTGFPIDPSIDRAIYIRFIVSENFTGNITLDNVNGSYPAAIWLYSKSGSNISSTGCFSETSLEACADGNTQLSLSGINFQTDVDYLIYIEYEDGACGFCVGGDQMDINISGVGSSSCLNSRFLPVVLKYFTAEVEHKAVRLDWATYTELNNERFIIERSVDGEHFEVIGEVPGAGNSTRTVRYHLYDTNPDFGLNYYRLKQVDYDGKFEYFDLQSVQFNNVKKHIRIKGNPVKDELKYELFYEKNDKALVQLTDISGKVITTQKVLNKQHISHQLLNVSHLEHGMYFLQLIVEGKPIGIQKIMKN